MGSYPAFYLDRCRAEEFRLSKKNYKNYSKLQRITRGKVYLRWNVQGLIPAINVWLQQSKIFYVYR